MLKRISLKYALIIFAVIAAITLIFIPIYAIMQKSLFINLEKNKMESFCKELTNTMDLSDAEMLEDYVEEYGEAYYTITIRDRDYNIIFTTNRHNNANRDGKKRPNDDFFRAEQYMVSSPAIYSENEGPDYESITIRSLFTDNNSRSFYIFIKENLRNVETIFGFTNRVLAGILIAYIIVCAIIILLLMGGITRSIRKLTDAVKKISEKDYSVRYEGKITSDEIGSLATNFNNMADTIQSNINSINNYNFLLKEDNEHLRESNRIRQSFVRNATHEFKTPLAIISGQVEMMYCTDDENKKAYYFESVLQEIQKMSRQITFLLNNHDTIHPKALEACRIDLSQAIDELCDSYNGIMLTKKISFQKNIQKNCYTRMVSSTVEHIFNNYLINAVKHTSAKAVISVTLKEFNNKYRLSVYNEGETIPGDSIDKIWNEFYTKNDLESDSSGLGLFIVKEISHIYQTDCGAINHDHGVEFWFDFEKEAT